MIGSFSRRDFFVRTAAAGFGGLVVESPLALAQTAFERVRYLLLDTRVIDRTEGVRLSLGAVDKHVMNPLFVEDKPWEQRFDNLYGNVIYDEEDRLYKCWYSPFVLDFSARGMSVAERLQKRYSPRPTPGRQGVRRGKYVLPTRRLRASNREMAICYATSRDGLVWEKPELGLAEHGGSKENNIVWRGAKPTGQNWYDPHGTGIFKDCDEPDPKRRYKAF